MPEHLTKASAAQVEFSSYRDIRAYRVRRYENGAEGGERKVKWISHQIVTGAVMYLATDSLLFSACGMVGAVLPDRLEGDPRRARDYWLWRRLHRGLSHWPGLYLFAIALVLSLRPAGAMTADDGAALCIAIMAGALLHIAEDALCGDVPLIFPGEKIGLKLFKVGSFTEYFFAALIVLIAYGLRLLHGG